MATRWNRKSIAQKPYSVALEISLTRILKSMTACMVSHEFIKKGNKLILFFATTEILLERLVTYRSTMDCFLIHIIARMRPI